MEEHNERLTSVLSAVYPWDHERSSFVLPGHALHEKGLQRQIGVCTDQQPGTKSSRRPADKPVVNRGFCSSIGLHRISFVLASEETFGTVSSMLRKARGKVVSWANRPVGVGVPFYPAPPRTAAPPSAAPPRPARGMSGVWTRQLVADQCTDAYLSFLCLQGIFGNYITILSS